VRVAVAAGGNERLVIQTPPGLPSSDTMPGEPAFQRTITQLDESWKRVMLRG
jgi:hypothetical protein